MSIIDRAKHFMGAHGATVRHVAVEGREPAAASLALADGGLKGTFAVAAEHPCTVRGRHTEVLLEIAFADGRTERTVIGRDAAPAEGVERPPGAVQYPFQLAAGLEVEDAFDLVFDGSIETLLEHRHLATGTPIRFYVRTRIDIEGSPFDPEAIDELPLAI